MDAASELLFCQQSEPAFHQVEPTGRGWRELQMKAWPFDQPVANQLRLVGSVVLQDLMHIQFRRHVLFDGIDPAAVTPVRNPG
jgi:hypothetical protein